ncbi:hydrolase [Cystobacter fuscus]|uniref:Hydrolase n=1 Tax=Cystobacter fuscus TaxID=43 RepID=A0A250IYY7_9BACT|nr:alpha/beta hydrolase [Cystobacter fuscus]ATB36361.1 hydrolase [Cystobacter fuscus]
MMHLNRLASAFAAFLVLGGVSSPVLAAPVKNVVLVHGAFVDGSGWKPVHDILIKHGYNVSILQHPMTSLEDDVAATKRLLDRQQGPVLLVGHSYGGTVITQAGTDPRVAGLVYIAAHMPDTGESGVSNKAKMPGASKAIAPTPDGFLFIDPARFHEDFAADLPREQAEFMARSQMPTSLRAMSTPIVNPAWKTKPSWMLVSTEDKIIHPELQRMYAARAHSHKVEVKGSHAVYVSHPKEVAALIEDAAKHAGD